MIKTAEISACSFTLQKTRTTIKKRRVTIASNTVRILASKRHGFLPRFFSVTVIDPDKPVRRKNRYAQKNLNESGGIFKDAVNIRGPRLLKSVIFLSNFFARDQSQRGRSESIKTQMCLVCSTTPGLPFSSVFISLGMHKPLATFFITSGLICPRISGLILHTVAIWFYRFRGLCRLWGDQFRQFFIQNSF